MNSDIENESNINVNEASFSSPPQDIPHCATQAFQDEMLVVHGLKTDSELAKADQTQADKGITIADNSLRLQRKKYVQQTLQTVGIKNIEDTETTFNAAKIKAMDSGSKLQQLKLHLQHFFHKDPIKALDSDLSESKNVIKMKGKCSRQQV